MDHDNEAQAEADIAAADANIESILDHPAVAQGLEQLVQVAAGDGTWCSTPSVQAILPRLENLANAARTASTIQHFIQPFQVILTTLLVAAMLRLRPQHGAWLLVALACSDDLWKQLHLPTLVQTIADASKTGTFMRMAVRKVQEDDDKFVVFPHFRIYDAEGSYKSLPLLTRIGLSIVVAINALASGDPQRAISGFEISMFVNQESKETLPFSIALWDWRPTPLSTKPPQLPREVYGALSLWTNPLIESTERDRMLRLAQLAERMRTFPEFIPHDPFITNIEMGYGQALIMPETVQQLTFLLIRHLEHGMQFVEELLSVLPPHWLLGVYRSVAKTHENLTGLPWEGIMDFPTMDRVTSAETQTALYEGKLTFVWRRAYDKYGEASAMDTYLAFVASNPHPFLNKAMEELGFVRNSGGWEEYERGDEGEYVRALNETPALRDYQCEIHILIGRWVKSELDEVELRCALHKHVSFLVEHRAGLLTREEVAKIRAGLDVLTAVEFKERFPGHKLPWARLR